MFSVIFDYPACTFVSVYVPFLELTNYHLPTPTKKSSHLFYNIL